MPKFPRNPKKKLKKLLQFNEKTKGFHMRYHLFLHYGWFLQNLGKDFIRTNMHTSVVRGSSNQHSHGTIDTVFYKRLERGKFYSFLSVMLQFRQVCNECTYALTYILTYIARSTVYILRQ